MSDQKKVEGFDEYTTKQWSEQFNIKILERIAHEDEGGNYETHEIHVVSLEGNKYAVITEDGCSCYDSSQAEIEMFPTKKAALAKFEEWKRGS